ncbi:MAG TPA: hypothetical protein VK607_14835 [Kofleriaceae bacterium]|nr:hypothetical protein [Kofleriaceae bacterium]
MCIYIYFFVYFFDKPLSLSAIGGRGPTGVRSGYLNTAAESQR